MDLDIFLPDYDFVEYHERFIAAPVEQLYSTLKRLDLYDSIIIRILMRLRGFPIDSFQNLFDQIFMILSEKPPFELVVGLIARPWNVYEQAKKIKVRQFTNFNEPGYAKIAWNFLFLPMKGQTLVSTETRIKCTDNSSRMKFRLYWLFVRPFSGLIRMEMLRLLNKKASVSRME